MTLLTNVKKNFLSLSPKILMGPYGTLWGPYGCPCRQLLNCIQYLPYYCRDGLLNLLTKSRSKLHGNSKQIFRGKSYIAVPYLPLLDTYKEFHLVLLVLFLISIFLHLYYKLRVFIIRTTKTTYGVS